MATPRKDEKERVRNTPEPRATAGKISLRVLQIASDAAKRAGISRARWIERAIEKAAREEETP